MRKNQQKTQLIKLCTKRRVKKRQPEKHKKNNEIKERDSQNVFQCTNQDIINLSCNCIDLNCYSLMALLSPDKFFVGVPLNNQSTNII